MNTFLKTSGTAVVVGISIAFGGLAAAQNAPPLSDIDLQQRVQRALHADPYFYDGHVEVSVHDGVVYLRGLVFSDWDMRDAQRIAHKASADRRVINDLTLIEGGRR